MTLPFYSKLKKEKNHEKSVNCFISGLPGSFFTRIFPSKSLNFFHSSSGVHWLSQISGMGETENHEAEKDKQEKKEKHADEDGKGEKGEKTKDKDKKKKDKSGKEDKKKKSPEDKKDPAYLKSKLEKLDVKIKDLTTKKEEILNQLKEVEANPAAAAAPPATA
ncbi:hypothetical protein POM88_051024 [Heracleum sosnowskyi]|uniref:Uncharacterized protein n=1 Tax=Heracleum sosnowskyi TaxID=360622 RepID=A0AAD8M3C0_9APIA|nr:hypothetical protein POM88_051024 [Heracleum sosnowskyi]